MSDLPITVEIHEEGPREGFQIAGVGIPSRDKIAFIDALSQTGVKHIQVASFVSPKLVPGWADADEVVGGFAPVPGVKYSALWFNEKGLDRAIVHRDRLSLEGYIVMSASEAFSRKNLNRDRPSQIEFMRRQTENFLRAELPVTKLIVLAATGCNFMGDVSSALVIQAIEDGLAVAAQCGSRISTISLADSMGWATPAKVARLVGETRSHWPETTVALHLHDTRGLGIASAYEGLRMGVTQFDSSVGGLGGCPFAGQPGAPGNIATE